MINEPLLRMLEDTRQLCLQDPYAKATRRVLLRDLKRRVDRGLWDGPEANPKLFQLDRCLTEPRVMLTWSKGFQGVLDMALRETDGNTGQSVRWLADNVESTVDAFATGKDLLADVSDVDREQLMQVRMNHARTECLAREIAEGGVHDIHGPAQEGYQLLGFGLSMVMWHAQGETGGLISALADARLLYAAEGAVDEMNTWFVGRDGVLWTASQQRADGAPIVLAWLPKPGQENWGHFGNIVHGLSRVINAVCVDDVPIWPADRPPNHPVGT